jgi:hypothetical protein
MTQDPNHPPESVEMPRPTVWPLVLAIGVGLMAVGIVTQFALSIVGALLLFVGLAGWIAQNLPGRGHMHEKLVEPAQRAVETTAESGPVQPLLPGIAGYRFSLPLKVHPISAGIKGGIAGGFVMPIPAIIYGFVSGHGPWWPINLLAGMVIPDLADADAHTLEQFHPLALLFGFIIHAILAVGIGTIYGVLTPTLPGPGGPLLWGGIITPAMWTLVSYGFMGIINPALQEHVDWLWYVVSQVVYGLTASAVIMKSQMVPTTQVSPLPAREIH